MYLNQNVTLLSTLAGELPTFERFLFNLRAYVLLLHRPIKLDTSILNTTICRNSYKTDVTADWKAVYTGSLKISCGLFQNLSQIIRTVGNYEYEL